MGYQFRMAPGVEKWVAGLDAHLRSTWHSAPSWLGRIGFWVARPGLDAAYQGHLVALTRVRRAVADAATSRKQLEVQIAGLERQADDPGRPDRKAANAGQGGTADRGQAPRNVTGQLAGLRHQYAGLLAREERLTAASRRLMAEIDAFRAGKEAAKAAYAAAEQAAGAVWAEVNR
jgi:phage shock protein A